MKRYLVVKYSTDFTNKYKNFKKEFKKHEEKFLERNTILKKKLVKSRDELFEITLIGYDGKKKYRTNKISELKKIIKLIDNMHIGKMEKKLKNIDLYTDAHKKKTIKNLGFKNKEKAIYSIKKVKHLSKKDQFRIINVLYQRAKYHPNITKDMKEAMSVLKAYLKKLKK